MILFGANILTDGASALAKRFRVSEFIIGLTIVAIGTSMPELVVSVLSVLGGATDMAIGNVVGSNLFNGLLILGITALIAPVPLTRNNIRRDIPMGFLAAMLLLLMVSDRVLTGAAADRIGRGDGAVLLLLFAAFMWYSVVTARHDTPGAPEEPAARRKPILLIAAMTIGGLAGLIIGGELFLNAAISIAQSLGVSERFISITLVAGGTSLPELAASAIAAFKGKPELALGNVLGSNISNILLILGTSSVIAPLTLGGVGLGDILAIAASAGLLMAMAFMSRNSRVSRWGGAVLIAAYALYAAWLIAGR